MTTKRTSRPMRLPNGFGSIVKLSGNRRHPYMARPAVKGYYPNGNPITPKAIGYYPDWHQAYAALLEYNQNPYDVDARRITFAEVYEKMVAEKKAGKKILSKSTYASYSAAFRNSSALHNIAFSEIRLNHLQGAIDNCPLKHASLEHIKNLYRQMYIYALKYDICQKDYSEFVTINIPDDDEGGVPFTEDEIMILWRNQGNLTVDIMLAMIYSGFRISAYKNLEINLEEHYFRGGVKTAAGKKRIVPIHDAIYPIVVRLCEAQGAILTVSGNTYRMEMCEALERLNIQHHTPHDCRHTFSWLCDKYGVDELSKKLMLGHSLGTDVTNRKYGHRTLTQLKAEIQKIVTSSSLKESQSRII